MPKCLRCGKEISLVEFNNYEGHCAECYAEICGMDEETFYEMKETEQMDNQ
jgi:hypothetical protein